MGRPRKIADDQVLSAAGAVIARLGPRFTLADVAREAGITAGTLIHRFGSRHGLLVAMIADAAGSARREDADLNDAADPLVEVREAFLQRYRALDDPAAAANNLAQLAFELTDPGLRERMAELYAAVEAGVERRVARAMAAGLLPGAPPAPVAARILAALADGAALRWSARPRGSLAGRMGEDLEAVLAGWARAECDETEEQDHG